MGALRVARLLEDTGFNLRLDLKTGKGGLDRLVTAPRIQKPGLALAGFVGHLHTGRVQVFGATEIAFLETLEPEAQRAAIDHVLGEDVPCIVVTKGLDPPQVVLEEAEKAETPLMVTPHLSSTFIRQVQSFLEEALMVATSLHGVLLDVFGVGILLLGKSGIGKSEIALDLVMRGHRLIADDIVDVTRRMAGAVIGAGSPIIKHHMEIRGLGIINIKDLFGVAAVRDRKRIELVVELVEWDPDHEYDRLGVEDRTIPVAEVETPYAVVPVRPGRNMTTIIEVAARNYLLKQQGHHAARSFADRLNRAITEGTMRRILKEEREETE